VDDLADEGRSLGFEARMSPGEGEARFGDTEKRWMILPRFGTRYPEISNQQEDNLTKAWILINSILKAIVPECVAHPNGGALSEAKDVEPGAQLVRPAPESPPPPAPSDKTEGEQSTGEKPPGPPGRVTTSRTSRKNKSPRASTGQAVPQALDSRAVGFAHEMLNQEQRINVAEIARRLECERTKLYDLTGFMALVKQDRASREAAKLRRPRGTKDRDTRTLEAWRADD
jgi:hypothetical protein